MSPISRVLAAAGVMLGVIVSADVDCSVKIKLGDYVLVEDSVGWRFTGLVHANDEEAYVRSLGISAVGKCLGAEFDIIGEEEAVSTFKILRAVPETDIALLMTAFDAVAEDDVSEVIKLVVPTSPGGIPTISDVDLPDADGRTLLSAAVGSNYDDIATALLHVGASPNVRVGRQAATVLMVAGGMNDVPLMELLIAKGADKEATVTSTSMSIGGYTALHIAAMRGNIEATEFILSWGVDSYAKGFNGKDVIGAMRDTLVTGTSQLSADARNTKQMAYSKLNDMINRYREKSEL